MNQESFEEVFTYIGPSTPQSSEEVKKSERIQKMALEDLETRIRRACLGLPF